MQKIKALSAVVLFLALVFDVMAAPGATATGVSMDNVNTVDELLKIENAKALDQSRKDALALGLSQEPDTQKRNVGSNVSPPATLFIHSISGVGDELRADVSYSGMRYERLREGEAIGPCQIKAIKGSRMTLAPTGKKTRSNQCPSADWTGSPSPVELTAGNINMLSRPMLPPLPTTWPLPAGAIASPPQAPSQTAR